MMPVQQAVGSLCCTKGAHERYPLWMMNEVHEEQKIYRQHHHVQHEVVCVIAEVGVDSSKQIEAVDIVVVSRETRRQRLFLRAEGMKKVAKETDRSAGEA